MAVWVAICEIFRVKEWCDLENRVRVRSRSLEMAPFDKSHTSSYSSSIVTMAISCIVCEILIGRKSRNFYTPPVFSTPSECDPVGISWCLMLVKLEWLSYRIVKKLWRYDKPFDIIPACHNRRTDRQTDRIAISISCISTLTRDKNSARMHARDIAMTIVASSEWKICRHYRTLMKR